MIKGYCVECGAGLEAAAVFCVSCGTAISVDPTLAAGDGHAPTAGAEWNGDTIITDDDLFTDGLPAIHDVPAATIVEEPDPVPALVRLEVSDAESGDHVVDFTLDAGQTVTIGRDGRATDYVPEDPRSSRRHFRIQLGDRSFILHDLGSSNGTYLNGARVNGSTPILDGDTLEYGRSRAIFCVLQEPDPWPDAKTTFR